MQRDLSTFDVQNCFCCGFNQSSRLALLLNEPATYVFIYTNVYPPGSNQNKRRTFFIKCFLVER